MRKKVGRPKAQSVAKPEDLHHLLTQFRIFVGVSRDEIGVRIGKSTVQVSFMANGKVAITKQVADSLKVVLEELLDQFVQTNKEYPESLVEEIDRYLTDLIEEVLG